MTPAAEKKSKLKRLQDLKETLLKKHATKDHKVFANEYVKIINKRGQKCPLNFNAIQEVIEQTIQELEFRGKPVRIIVLKARQEGVSTYTQSRILWKTATKENRNALVVAHKDESTRSIFEKAKLMYENLPENIKPLKKASNESALIFDLPTNYKGQEVGLNSKIKVATAGGEGIARGDTYMDVHLSEFAFYPGNPEVTLNGILQAVPMEPDTSVIIESTANGYNTFKKLWDAAVRGENDFVPLFFAWHDFEEYRIPLESKDEREKIELSLTEYEKKLIEICSIDLEQVKWYRWKLKNDCGGNADLMRQENPSFDTEAFLTTGTSVFPNDVIEYRIAQLRQRYEKEPPLVGDLKYDYDEQSQRIIDTSIRFVPNKHGWLTIYKKPEWGRPYCVGGDVAEGGIDSSTASVIDNVTEEQIAVFKGHMDTDVYAKQMYCLGKYYNDALLSIEANFDSHPLKELSRLNYPFIYVREKIDKITNQRVKQYGWLTTSRTRPIMIDHEVSVVRDHIELINDIPTLQEMLVFVRDQNGKPQALIGEHDDLVLADSIVRMCRSQYTIRVREPKTEMNEIQLHKHRLAKQLHGGRGTRRLC